MSDFSHVDEHGSARMVDVSHKSPSHRVARARGHIRMNPSTLEAIRQNLLVKGDVLTVAKVAGIMAAKRTSELIPLCHPLPLSHVDITFRMDETLPGVVVESSAETTATTGVEMEAMTAVSVTLITLYDMAKGVDRSMVIGEICITEKRGGKSGDWVRP
jgi:cyclic pyranopterin monophosphate synthase